MAQSDTNAPSVGTKRGPVRSFEREQAFFGFHPAEFVDNVINAVNEILCDVTEGLQAVLEAEHAMESAVAHLQADQVMRLLQHAVDKNFDRFELYVLNNIFTVPDALRMPEEMAEEEDSADDDVPTTLEPVDMRLAAARARLSAAYDVRSQLRTAVQRAEAQAEQHQSLMRDLKLLADLQQEAKLGPLDVEVEQVMALCLRIKRTLATFEASPAAAVHAQRVLERRGGPGSSSSDGGASPMPSTARGGQPQSQEQAHQHPQQPQPQQKESLQQQQQQQLAQLAQQQQQGHPLLSLHPIPSMLPPDPLPDPSLAAAETDEGDTGAPHDPSSVGSVEDMEAFTRRLGF